jgi:hypothetical protein
MEIILGLALIVIALVAFLSISSSSTQQALQSRNHTVAIVLANTLFDEVQAHQLQHYGEPPPKDWSATVQHPVQAWVEGRVQQMDFHAAVNTTNGSFTDKAKTENYDNVNITISWHEGEGNPQAGVIDPKDNKVYSVLVAVWRP